MFDVTFIDIYCDSSTTGYGIYVPMTKQGFKGAYTEKKTVNEGEFIAMLSALTVAEELCMTSNEIIIYSDSQLVVNSLTKNWTVRASNLIPWVEKCREKYAALIPHGIRVHWIPREKNQIADALSHGGDISG